MIVSAPISGLLAETYAAAGFIRWYAIQKQAESQDFPSREESEKFHALRARLRNRVEQIRIHDKAWLKKIDAYAAQINDQRSATGLERLKSLQDLLQQISADQPLPTPQSDWQILQHVSDNLMSLCTHVHNAIEVEIEAYMRSMSRRSSPSCTDFHMPPFLWRHFLFCLWWTTVLHKQNQVRWREAPVVLTF